jgi:hypothetical protein
LVAIITLLSERKFRPSSNELPDKDKQLLVKTNILQNIFLSIKKAADNAVRSLVFKMQTCLLLQAYYQNAAQK